ncbi:segmentation protein cap'n'collar [Sergentomyia squamirostris]
MLEDLPRLEPLSPNATNNNTFNGCRHISEVALVLSLLRVDPSDYWGYGWESQLALQNGEGWQLELRAATPLTDINRYSNRKAVIPLIEDLVRFNHNSNDVTAYLLNSVHHNDHISASGENFTAGAASTSASDASASVNASAAGQRTQSGEESLPATVTSVEFDDLFLTNAPFADSASIYDENLADLTEFGETIASVYPYLALPAKDELLLDSEPPTIDEFLLSGAASNYGMPESPSVDDLVEWEDFYSDRRNSTPVTVKTEPQEVPPSPPVAAETVDADAIVKSEDCESSSDVSLTPEESELIEVLWKQDVDLGFSLAPPATTSLKKEESHCAADDVEKLKALLELKNEKPEDTEKEEEFDHDWPNLPIDAETGEYIQKLPLQLDDSLLQEALHQLDDLAAEQDALKDDAFDFEPKREPLDSVSSGCFGSDGGDEVKSPLDREDSFDLSEDATVKSDDTNELEELLCDMMIQSSSGTFQHPRSVQGYGHGMNSYRQSSYHHHHQPRVPLSRAVSMEQRWQDLANLLSLSPGMGVGMGVGDISSHPHYSSHYSYQQPSIPQHSQFPHPHSHPAVLHNASLSDLGAAAAGQPHYGPNLGSAVASSMHLTNSSTETDGGASGYKMDPDILYYSNTSSEINSTTDGFLNSILNDEDLQLMDIGMNEGRQYYQGMYTMRMLDHNSTSNNSTATNGALGLNGAAGGLSNGLGMQTNLTGLGGITGAHGDRLDTSSDSAVSSMGSERVPSLSDGEWGDGGSDSAQEYQSKYGGPYDYSYSGRLGDSAAARQPPVAQKKHHMFAKRYFQEQNSSSVPPSLGQPSSAETMPPTAGIKYEYDQYSMGGAQGASGAAHGSLDATAGAMGPAVPSLMNAKSHHLAPPLEIKYSCSHDFAARQTRGSVHDLVSHNHTYTLPQNSGVIPKPQARDKKAHKKSEDEHLTRDEKRAKALGIPMPVNEIINLPMDEFNERLSKYELSETQLSLIRDIRRRGKNKVAAQNCRKRKLDQILSLADEVKEVRERKTRLIREQDSALMEQKRVMDKFTALYRHVFQYMRDQDGNPYSSSHYSLQLSADGSVYVLPREPKAEGGSSSGSGSQHNHHHQHQHQKE